MSIDFGSDIYEEPIVAKTFLQEDAQEGSLRPKTLREYIGQEKAKENLSVFIEAARKREEALDHVLLHGPPGLGKTTLAGIIAQEMGAGIRITSGPAIEKPGDLAALLTNLNEGDILFVDEIHRARAQRQLHPAGLAQVHPDRCHHPGRTALRASAGPLRRYAAAGALHPGGAFQNRHPLGGNFERGDRARRRL